MRLLVVGANGLLGSNVVTAAEKRNWRVSGTFHSERPAFDVPLSQFDLEGAHRFDQVLEEHHPDVVVNCAAMTDVDACEAEPKRADRLNGDAPGRMAACCRSSDTEFVQVSTDYVFDGTSRDPYTEGAEPAPVQVYGESKLTGERAVRDESGAPIVSRLSFVWGVHRAMGELTGFPAWICDRLRREESIPLFTDQWISPTRAGDAAETLLDLIEQNVTGLYHVTSDSCVTPYDFGELIADVVDAPDGLLTEGSMNGIEREASRPTHTCLDVTKVESTLSRPQPTVREDVETLRGRYI
jgi:dTDP-4-dehydrorhamnose reductase